MKMDDNKIEFDYILEIHFDSKAIIVKCKMLKTIEKTVDITWK